MIRAAALAVALALAGCTAFNPYETVPLASPPGDPKPRVGICYDGFASSDAEVAAAARTACGPHMRPRRIDTGYELVTCPLLLPQRATFLCVPQK